MRESALLRIFGVVVLVLVFGVLACPAWAQRGGGHGGGGGFHGGGMGGFHGGGGSFHGGGFAGGGHFANGGVRYGGFRGGYRGAGYGWRGGWGRPVGWGWRGRYWGYPWGWGFGFGWPWWGWGWGYPYGYYGYPWYGPYPDYDNYDPSYFCPPGYPCPGNQNDTPPPPNSGPNSGYSPGRTSRTPAYGGVSCINCEANDPKAGDTNAGRTDAPILSVDHLTATPSSYRVARTPEQQNSSFAPDVRNAMRHLREMPPFARQREIETGRYSHFSPQKKALLRQIDQQLGSGWAD